MPAESVAVTEFEVVGMEDGEALKGGLVGGLAGIRAKGGAH
jgi:hypothetical protein